MIARLGVPTGDGRIIAPGGMTSRSLPLPLMWQELSGDGHGGAAVVGRIESMQFGDGMITATGTMLDSAPASVIEQLEAGVIGPSVDLDDVEYVMDGDERIVITSGRVAGATLVSIPAFADVGITLDPESAQPTEVPSVPEVSEEWILASAAPVVLPPAEWFEKPDLDRVTPLTISDTGRVFGHIAPWGQCHVGMPGCVTAPSSPSEYAYFHQGAQRLSDGRRIPVGVLVAGPRHADPQAAFHAATAHYDDKDAAVAKVVAGEDEFGIWVAGWILPEAKPEALDVFSSNPVSGDWRMIGGNLELIAVCSVNSAGFPIPRARVAFSQGEGQRTLVASFGITPQRVAKLESGGPARAGGMEESIETARAKWAWASTQKGR